MASSHSKSGETGEDEAEHRRQVRARQAALTSAAVTIVAIIGVTNFIIAHAATLNGSVVVPGFLNVAFYYNRGISLSLFAQDTQAGSRILSLVALLLIAAAAVWAYRTPRTVIGVGLGVIIGGALVNALDRTIHGTVFDYLDMHLGSLPLFVCNAPDIAISLGVITWFAGEFFSARPNRKPHT